MHIIHLTHKSAPTLNQAHIPQSGGKDHRKWSGTTSFISITNQTFYLASLTSAAGGVAFLSP